MIYTWNKRFLKYDLELGSSWPKFYITYGEVFSITRAAGVWSYFFLCLYLYGVISIIKIYINITWCWRLAVTQRITLLLALINAPQQITCGPGTPFSSLFAGSSFEAKLFSLFQGKRIPIYEDYCDCTLSIGAV